MSQRNLPSVFLARSALAAAVSTALLLAGCGGGGGDSAGQGPAPFAATLAVTSANAKPVAADALFGATGTDAAELGTQFATAVQVDGGSATSASLQLAATAQVVAGKVRGVQGLATGVAVNDTIPCSSGSLTVSGDIASDTGPTAGDTLRVVANSCVEVVNGVSSTLNGQLDMRFITVSGNTHVVMGLQATGLRVTANGKTRQTDGDMTLDLTVNNDPSESLVITGQSLTSTVSGGRTYTLKNFRQSLFVDSVNTTTYNVTADIETNNPRLGGGTQGYSVSTPTPLTANFTGAFTGGSLKVTGKGSALLLTVTGTDAFQVQVDENGDGTFESTTTSTASELRSLT